MKNLTKRILVALWGIPLLLGLSYFGSYFFLFLILVINGVALYEFYAMFRNKEIYANSIVGLIIGSLMVLSAFFQSSQLLIFLLMGGCAWILLAHLRRQEGLISVNTSFTVLGIFYISFFLSTLLMLRLHFAEWVPEQVARAPYAGGRYLIMLLGAIWLCDTAAYSAGSKLGRHKLAPQISPNKTIEGAVAGLITSFISFVVLGWIFLPELSLTMALASGAIVGVFGQLGDLVESRFKRDAGVKDTSSILPGHGGLLDRFDSLIFVSPFLYALFYFSR